MSNVITTCVVGNVEAMELIEALGRIGIAREQIRMQEPATEPEHGHDAYDTWSGTCGVIGALLGLTAGWLALSWSPLPWAGALGGGAIGAICGARYGGYTVVNPRAHSEKLPLTRVEIETDDAELARRVRRLCSQRESRKTATAR